MQFHQDGFRPGDPRVAAATNWIRQFYTLDENPGMGQKTVYYYYMVFAKALQALGQPTIVDARGRSHTWREELGVEVRTANDGIVLMTSGGSDGIFTVT